MSLRCSMSLPFMSPGREFTMSRIFIYSRVSTVDQSADNQKTTIETALGIKVHHKRYVSEVVSGGVMAMEREAFKALVEHKLEEGDCLVVSKLDRLGRDNIDVQTTITMLHERGIKVRCLDIPVEDLTSSEGKLMLTLIAAFAEFERNRISERTKEGLAAKRAEAKARGEVFKVGRPPATKTNERVQSLKSTGKSQSKVADLMGVSVKTVKRHWNVEL